MRIRWGGFVVASAALAVSACTSSGGAKTVDNASGDWFQARPLIMPGQHTTGTARSDPFGSLQVPPTEDAYAKLSPAQQTDLANALHAVDCAHPPQLSDSADRVVCDADSDVYLLGAPLFTAADVANATALPPSASVADWQLSIGLRAAAAARMHQWTTGHHVVVQSGVFTDVQSSSKPPCGATMTTRCSDFTAYISANAVVTVPVSFAVTEHSVVISGVFNGTVATRLAHKLSR
jgi:hypothetical protein